MPQYLVLQAPVTEVCETAPRWPRGGWKVIRRLERLALSPLQEYASIEEAPQQAEIDLRKLKKWQGVEEWEYRQLEKGRNRPPSP